MKIALCQLNSTVGDVDGNLKKIEEVVENLNYRRADIFVFPELFIPGYPPRDLLDHSWFNQQSGYALDRLRRISESLPEKAILTGIALPTNQPNRHRLYNSAVVVANGEIIFTQHKTLLPSYDVFDEHRYFEEAREHDVFHFANTTIGITICEDMWTKSSSGIYRSYDVNPVHRLTQKGAEIIINISASPFHKNKGKERTEMISRHAVEEHIPFVMVNAVGANDELIFDGGSTAVDAAGEIVCRLPRFEELLQIIDTSDFSTPVIAEEYSGESELYKAATLGIRDYFHKTGFKKALIGLSGGIDSAVTAALAVAALGPENVWGITMPSRYSSEGSVSDSAQLAQNLGITVTEIPIEDIYTSFFDHLAPHFDNLPPNTAEENLQSRIRGTLLMSLSNKFGYLVLNTGNKSEMAVGYCTLYGDMNGAVSVLADIYKSEVFDLARYINRHSEVIPSATILKPPSAELRPDQRDDDTLPPYDVLDALLKRLLEEDASATDLIAGGFDAAQVKWVIGALKTNEYKRRQAPPVLKVTPKAFGMGRRFPIAAAYEW
ncbi:MAG: NAD+ synthase [Fibrobacterota bacterium]